MKKLFELAEMLQNLKMFKVSLEVDFPELMFYKKEIDEYMKGSTLVSFNHDPNEHRASNAIFLKVYGVQMLIQCRNVAPETEL